MAEIDHPEKISRDTSAELSEDESVVKEPAALNEDMETITGKKPIDEEAADSEESGNDELDEDQQRAFEHILAQIESDGQADAGSVIETGQVPESDPADDFPAGLEKVEKEVDADDDAGPDDARHSELRDDESHHSSYDIEDILTAIASSDDASPATEAASDDSGSETAAVETSDKNRVDDDIVAHQKADNGLEHTDRPQTAIPAGQNDETAEPDERSLTKGPSVDPRSATKPIPVTPE